MGDLVSAPYPGSRCWVIGVATVKDSIVDSPVEGSALIGTGPFAYFGWHYAHIDVNNSNYRLRLGMALSRDIISDLILVPDLGSHVHFSWLGRDSYQEPFKQPGYFNPFEYLSPPLTPLYDEAVFGPVDYRCAYECISAPNIITNTNIVYNLFFKEGCYENWNYFSSLAGNRSKPCFSRWGNTQTCAKRSRVVRRCGTSWLK